MEINIQGNKGKEKRVVDEDMREMIPIEFQQVSSTS
jgi:hypothetical protein